ncbi:MAG: diguanylate cyclase [Sideroxyarcus sp.]
MFASITKPSVHSSRVASHTLKEPVSHGWARISSLAGVAGVTVLLALSLINEYREADKQARSEVETLSRVLEEHAHAIVQQVDLVLHDVQSHVRPDDMRLTRGTGDSRTRKFHALLKSHVDKVPEVSLLHLINARGEHIHSALTTLPNVNLADRPYFQRQRNDAAAGLVISSPIISRVTKNWTLILSRRINFEDGSFAGTVQASLDMEYFQQFYRSLNLDKHGMVALNDKQLSLAARFPPSEKDMGTISLLDARFFIEKGITHATYHAKSPVDSIKRIYSFRQVGNLPLFVFAGIAEDDYLAEWRRHAWQYGIGLVIFSLMVMSIGQRQRRAEEALLKSEDRFRSALEHAPIGMALESPDGQFVQVNRAFCDITGYEPEELLNLTFSQITHPDDVSKDSAYLKLMEAGEIQTYEIEKRYLRKDGRIVWVQNTVSMSRGAKGTQRQIIQQIQDITERKELAKRLEHEARTDCLTGLSNRRHFLELASQELARVRRYRSPLTLAMLDVDHFKTINDTHGHEVGDRVLKELAETCRRTLRETDVVGRIGGEEFAILFPQTASGQAYEIAERLRIAISAAEIPVEHGQPVHFSVSLGITSFTESDTGIDMLLSRADKALYEAKHNGRNRVVIEGTLKFQ